MIIDKIRRIKKVRILDEQRRVVQILDEQRRVNEQRTEIANTLSSIINIDGTPYLSINWLKKNILKM